MNNTLSWELVQLKELLFEGEELFEEIIKVEEELQDYIIRGDHQNILETQDYRDALMARLASFEKKGNSLVPEGTEITLFINSEAEGRHREQLLGLYNSVNDKLNRLNVMHNINKNLLEERLRFTKEMQKVLLPPKEVYDHRGQLKDNYGKDNLNINKTC